MLTSANQNSGVKVDKSNQLAHSKVEALHTIYPHKQEIKIVDYKMKHHKIATNINIQN